VSANPYHLAVGRTTDKGLFLVLGSGTLIGPDRVLTSTHIFADERGLEVRIADWPNRVPCAVAVSRPKEELDITVLRLARPVSSHFARLKAGQLAAETPVEMQGFPYVESGVAMPTFEKVGARTRSYNVDEEVLWLDASTHPDVWGGLSGAGVVANNFVVGVFQGFRTGYDGRRCAAIPVARFVDEEWFQSALGLTQEEQRWLDEEASLPSRIASCLATHDGLRTRLAKRFTCASTDSQTVSIALCSMERPAAVKALRESLSPEPPTRQRERPDVRKIALLLLMYSTDWREVIIQGRAAYQQGRRQFVLPCRLDVAAHVALAGIRGHEASFEMKEEGRVLSAIGFVSLPSVAFAPLRMKHSLMRDAVKAKLEAEFGVANEHLRQSLAERFGTTDLKGDTQLGALDENLRDAEEEGMPISLCVVDELFEGAEGGQIAWQIVGDALSEIFPYLHLVRLTGSGRAVGSRDQKMAIQLRHLFKD
jgi:hypothetical protein